MAGVLDQLIELLLDHATPGRRGAVRSNATARPPGPCWCCACAARQGARRRRRRSALAAVRAARPRARGHDAPPRGGGRQRDADARPLSEPGGADAAPVAPLTGLPRTRMDVARRQVLLLETAGAAARMLALDLLRRAGLRRRGGLAGAGARQLKSRRPELLVTGLPLRPRRVRRTDRGVARRAAAPARGRAGRRRQRLRAFAAGQRARRASAATTSRARWCGGGHAGARRLRRFGRLTSTSDRAFGSRIDVQRSWRQRAVQAARGASMRRSARADCPALLDLAAPPRTHFASSARCVPDTAASMKTAALIARAAALRCSAPRRTAGGPRRPLLNQRWYAPVRRYRFRHGRRGSVGRFGSRRGTQCRGRRARARIVN